SETPKSAGEPHHCFQPFSWTQRQAEAASPTLHRLASVERLRFKTQATAGPGMAAAVLAADAANRRRIARDIGIGKDREAQILPGSLGFGRGGKQTEDQNGDHAFPPCGGPLENA